MSDILNKIVAVKHEEIAQAQAKKPLAQVREDPQVGVLVLGANHEKSGPGPLVTALTRSAGTLPVPITIVPGAMSKERLESIT